MFRNKLWYNSQGNFRCDINWRKQTFPFQSTYLRERERERETIALDYCARLFHFLISHVCYLCIVFVNQPGFNHDTAWCCFYFGVRQVQQLIFFPSCLASSSSYFRGPGGSGSPVCCLLYLGNMHSARGGSGVGHSGGALWKRWCLSIP